MLNYRDVHGVILVYDITDKPSFERLKYWMDDLEINGNKMEERILVGSKIDREADREISLFKAKKFATEHSLQWAECSAKTGVSVIDMFEMLVKKIIESHDNNPEFRILSSRSTIISAAGAISNTEGKHRKVGTNLMKGVIENRDRCC